MNWSDIEMLIAKMGYLKFNTLRSPMVKWNFEIFRNTVFILKINVLDEIFIEVN